MRIDLYEKNQSMEDNTKLTQMLTLADKNIKIVSISIFYMLKKLSRDMKDI